jgi:hypothetical protein
MGCCERLGVSGVRVDEIIFKKSLRAFKSGDKMTGSAEKDNAKCQARSVNDSRKKFKII